MHANANFHAKKACCGYLKMQLHPSNCLGIAKFADSQSCLKLYQDAREFAYREFIQLSKHQEFLEMESKGGSLHSNLINLLDFMHF